MGATTSWDDRAGFSTFSSDADDWVDLLAPGDSIIATVPNAFCPATATQCFGWKRGTSMASPHVAGVAALVLSYLQRTDAANANRGEVRRRMQDWADATGAIGQDMLVWSRYGRLNAAAALNCGGGGGGGGGDTGGGGGGSDATGTHIAELTASSSSGGGNVWASVVAGGVDADYSAESSPAHPDGATALSPEGVVQILQAAGMHADDAIIDPVLVLTSQVGGVTSRVDPMV